MLIEDLLDIMIKMNNYTFVILNIHKIWIITIGYC